MCCSAAAVSCIALQCFAMCGNVLWCVIVCCSALQCVAVCCSALQCVAVPHLNILDLASASFVPAKCVVESCSGLQWAALCSSVLQCVVHLNGYDIHFKCTTHCNTLQITATHCTGENPAGGISKCVCVCVRVCICVNLYVYMCVCARAYISIECTTRYAVATISKITGLFCKRAL